MLRSWGARTRRYGLAYDGIHPGLPPDDDRWYDWSLLGPPEWIFQPGFVGCRPIQDRLELHVADWWQPSKPHAHWLTMQTWYEDDAFAWWDLGDSRTEPPVSPESKSPAKTHQKTACQNCCPGQSARSDGG